MNLMIYGKNLDGLIINCIHVIKCKTEQMFKNVYFPIYIHIYILLTWLNQTNGQCIQVIQYQLMLNKCLLNIDKL